MLSRKKRRGNRKDATEIGETARSKKSEMFGRERNQSIGRKVGRKKKGTTRVSGILANIRWSGSDDGSDGENII